LLAALGLAACATTPPLSPATRAAQAACAALVAPIDAAGIGLPTGGAQITSATLAPPAAMQVPRHGPIVPAAPEHCRVLGRIAPATAGAPSIEFQLNLPSMWNGRALQYGAEGFDGALATGLALPPAARLDRPAPLALGFATYGSDAGHRPGDDAAALSMVSSDEALVNFAHGAFKKARDVAVQLMQRRYGRAPDRLYFVGSGEGGREALAMAQHYPADFDGIFARVPAVYWTGLQHANFRNGLVQIGGGWLRPPQVRWVAEAVQVACDALDGLADGIVADPSRCREAFDIGALRCPGGVPAGDRCLSDAQVRSVRTLHSPFAFDFDLAHGARSYPAWPLGGEAAPPAGTAGGWLAWWSGLRPPVLPARVDNGRGWQIGSTAIGRFIVRDADFDMIKYDPNRFSDRVRQISALMDAGDPDLSAFAARGGKLLLLEHMADQARSPYAGIEYFKALRVRMGEAAVDAFARLYLVFGVDHVGQGAPSAVDMLDVLVDWVEHGQAPSPLEVQSLRRDAPYAAIAARPLCRWPMYPRYRGQGDVNLAASFECTAR
jgi:hypothetical protein